MELREAFLRYKTWKEMEPLIHTMKGKIPFVFKVDDEMILTASEIAELLGVSQETVRRWCREFKLRVLSPGGHYRVRGEDLKEFVFERYREQLIKEIEDNKTTPTA